MKATKQIKTGTLRTAAYAILAFSLIGAGGLAQAQTSVAPAAVHQTAEINLPSGDFVKKKKSISGNWSVVQENGQTIIRFADDFKTKKGPDLKIFLSPQTLQDVNGKTATSGAINLGVLKSTKGTQDYLVPAGVDLSNFNSVLVHCEAYSILWGGGAL